MNPEQFKELERVSGDRVAQNSLEWYERTRGPRSKIETSTVLRHLALGPTLRLLDAGSGVGRFTLEAAPHVAQVHAVDISPKCIDQLLEHARSRGLTNVSAAASDLNSMQVKMGSFDRAVAIEVLQHIPTAPLRHDAVTRIFQALRPGGRFVTVNYRWHGMIHSDKEGTHRDGRYRFAFEPDELKELLFDCGFRHVRLHGCVNLPYRFDGLLRLAPTLLVPADVALSFWPGSVHTGKFLLASGVKEAG